MYSCASATYGSVKDMYFLHWYKLSLNSFPHYPVFLFNNTEKIMFGEFIELIDYQDQDQDFKINLFIALENNSKLKSKTLSHKTISKLINYVTT